MAGGLSGSVRMVLVHGGFLGPWLWGDVQDLLAERGIDSVAPDLPSVATGGDLYADVAAVEAAIAESDVAVLCGHSYAGMVITETAARSGLPIRHLIYVAAAVPDSGQSLETLVASLRIAGDDDGGEEVVALSDGRIELTPEAARRTLFHDCSPDRAAEAIAQLRPINPVTSTQIVAEASWRRIPATLVEASHDRLPRLVCREFDGDEHDLVTLPTGHCPQWSRPDLMADCLAEIAQQSR